jgi:tetratricopeptide (TPR) repeat protein
MKTYRLLLLIVLAAALASDSRIVADEKSWVGESIIYTKPAKDIQFGDIVDGKEIYFPFSGRLPIKVRNDRDGWLRIHDGHREGWAQKADFVLARDASAYFHRRVQANPKDIFALFMRGGAWLEKGESDNAIVDFNECIRLNPADSAAFNSRGMAWSNKKEYDKALKDYDEAIRLNPKLVLALINRSNAWSDKKEYDKALKDLDEAIHLDPACAIAFNNRGIIWSDKKAYDKALKDLDEAIRLDPNYANAFYSKACCLALKGQTDLAIDNLQKSLELGFRNFDDLKTDSDLDSLRSKERYQKLLEKYAK